MDTPQAAVRDILQARGVACHWKQTIETSVHLKRAIFLVADGTPMLPLPVSPTWWLSTVLLTSPDNILPLFETTYDKSISTDLCSRP